MNSVCSRAFVLAAAGLLKGRRATTHWADCGLLDNTYADVPVDPDGIYVHGASVWNSQASPSGSVSSTPRCPRARALAGLARCDEAAGDATAAGERYDELLELSRRVGEPGLTSTALEGFCGLAIERGDRALASTRLAEAAQLRTGSARSPPHERRDLAAVIVDLATDPVSSRGVGMTVS